MTHEKGDLRNQRHKNTNLPTEGAFMWMDVDKLYLPRTHFYKRSVSRATEGEQVNHLMCAPDVD